MSLQSMEPPSSRHVATVALTVKVVGALVLLLSLTLTSRGEIQFTDPVPIDSIAYNSQHPQLTTDQKGTWLVVWQSQANLDDWEWKDFDILAAISKDNGRSWTAPAILGAVSPSMPDRYAHVATNGLGSWVTVWNSGTWDVYASHSTNEGEFWSNPIMISEDGGYTPRIATDRLGTWLAYWQQGGGLSRSYIYLVRSTDIGATWTLPEILFTGGYSNRTPQIATDNKGTWVAVWWHEQVQCEESILVVRSTDNGLTWSQPSLLSGSVGNHYGQTQIKTDGLGNWLVVWQSRNWDIVASHSTANGANWSYPCAISRHGADSEGWMNPDLATDGAGNWVAVWNYLSGFGGAPDSDIYAAHSTDNGETWTSPVTVNNDAEHDFRKDKDPKIQTDGLGNWVVIWERALDQGIHLYSSTFCIPIQDRAAISLTPTLLAFADRDTHMGSSAPKLVTITNTGEEPLSFTGAGIVIAGTDAESFIITSPVDLSPLPPAGRRFAEVAFDPQREGHLESYLSITTDNQDIPFATIQLSGTGVQRAPNMLEISSPRVLNSNADSDRGYSDDSPSLATDGAGHWIATWDSYYNGQDWEVYTSCSSDNGQTWMMARPLTQNISYDDYSAHVASDGMGNWVSVWSLNYGRYINIQTSCSTDNGISWTTPKSIIQDDALNFHPKVATDGEGHWVTVWEHDTIGGGSYMGSDLYVSRSENSGETWTQGTRCIDVGVYSWYWQDHDPQFMTDGSGNWVFTWCSSLNLDDTVGVDRDVLLSRSINHGLNWTDTVGLPPSSDSDWEDDYEPALAMDSEGNWIAVWSSGENLMIGTDLDILVSRSADHGITWTPAVVLSHIAAWDTADDRQPEIATDGEGNWAVVWQSVENLGGVIGEDSDLFVSYSTDGGATWTATIPLNTNASSDSGHDTNAQIKSTGPRSFLVVWHSSENLGGNIGTDLDILYATFLIPEETRPKISVSPDSLDFGNWNILGIPSPPQAVIVSNIGSATLNFTGKGVEIIGEDATHFSLTSPLDMSPLGLWKHRTMEIAFAPTTAGPKHALLRLTSDDINLPVVDISLTGVGLPLTPTPTGTPTATPTFTPPFLQRHDAFLLDGHGRLRGLKQNTPTP